MAHFFVKFYKGKRIRASDRRLVFRFAATSLSLIFLLVLLIFHGKWLIHWDGSKVQLLRDGRFQLAISLYLVFTVLVAAAVSVSSA